MTQWDIYSWAFPHGEHPAVIISPPDRLNTETVNVLFCSSHRASRPPGIHEVLLNSADGLDWPTLCRCDFFWTAAKSELTRRRGSVSTERRREIGNKIIRLFGFWAG